MKKWYAILSACLLSTALVVPVSVNAAAAERPVRVYIDGKLIKFDVQPVLENGTTLVQFRPIFEKMGLAVGWESDTKSVTGIKDDLTIKLVIDNTDAYVNDRLNELELAPRLVDGNTLVPLRFVSEACGKEVTWIQNSATIYLKTPVVPKESGNSGGAKDVPSSNDTTDRSKTGDYLYPNGNKYTGQLSNGVPEGKGKVVNESGKLLFDGTMTIGIPVSGRSKSYYENGQIEFDGLIKDGVNNGAGKQYSTSGSLLFDGTFFNGERSKGTLYYDNGDKYIGPFDNDKPSGGGKLVYKNGDIYEGDFVGGNREGRGTYTTTKGEKIVGDFKNNAMDGIISHYDKKGTLLSVSEYSNDALIRKVDMGNGSSTLPNTNPTTQQDPLRFENDRHEKTMNIIKEQYNQNKKQIEDQIAQIRKENPGIYSSQAEYDKALQDANTKQTEIISKMNTISNDSSKAAEAARTELDKQLSDVQVLISQIYTKRAVQQRIESLKDQLTQMRISYDADLKRENDQHVNIIKQLK